MQCQDLIPNVRAVIIHFPKDEKSDGELEVRLVYVTGEALTLNESSLLSQPLQVKTDCVLSAILVTQVLTLLLSSWTESATRIIVGQPKMLDHFLIISERIIRIWEQRHSDILAFYGKKLPWSRR